MKLLNKILGDANEKYLKSLQPLVQEINDWEDKLKDLSAEQLAAKTDEFKTRLKQGASLDDILAEAFAVVREAALRTTGMRPYDVQLIGGIVLHHGQIAEMRTGEGKTLVATMPVYLNALSGKGVHVVTVNDYLAKRDAVWMSQVYSYLGLSVGVIQHEAAFLYDSNYTNEAADRQADQRVEVDMDYLKPCARKEAYQADITYGTNNEFGFDYLKDNMVQSTDQMVQRDLHFTIVDEVDSILIDEARTPLIISAPAEDSAQQYYQFARLVKRLREEEDYNVDEKMKAVTLTEDGISKMEKALGVTNIYESKGLRTVHHLEQALKAQVLFKRDRDYVVKEGEVIIVDEFTGRLMHGRRYSEGLHQAIEAKENVQIQKESVTLATITFQNFFRMYDKLSGMTGTAVTEAEEFAKIYHLEVTVIPTNKPIIRQDRDDLIYQSEIGKFNAIVQDIKDRQIKGQPVLVGTISIAKNELLSSLLNQAGVKHQILNAKQHEAEAAIIAQAGRPGTVTIATNMAGRGVDIILGGNPTDKEEARQVREKGGLLVIGTERHESRRIDNQLRGRAGRQGDPGETRFYVSLEDDLMRIFGSERMKSIMRTLNVPEDMPIENKIISRSIEGAQKKVEGYNFDVRKHLVEYDDIINKHREVIYRRRRQLLELYEGKSDKLVVKDDDEYYEFTSLTEYVAYLVNNEMAQVVTFHTSQEGADDFKEIWETAHTIYSLTAADQQTYDKIVSNQHLEPHQLRHEILQYFSDLTEKRMKVLTESVSQGPLGEVGWNRLLLTVLLRTIDNLWLEHLEAIDYLRQGIGLRGYGQRDPLVEYKRESYKMFSDLLASIQNQVAYNIFKLGQTTNLGNNTSSTSNLNLQGASQQTQFATEQQQKQAASAIESKPRDDSGHKVGRNDPCPCGSGKKYKRCHGA